MTSAATPVSAQREPELAGQTVVVIGGSAGIGLETARHARAEGADVILTGRNPGPARARGRGSRRAAHRSLRRHRLRSPQAFFHDLPTPIDHVMVTGPGPYYGPLPSWTASGHTAISTITCGWLSRSRGTASEESGPGGTLLFMAGTGGRRAVPACRSCRDTAALPALIANLAVEIAPIRVNLIAAGFVDTPLSASLLGDDFEARRDQLRATLPDRARGRPGRRRRAGRAHHDQHRADRRDLRHRRRPATDLLVKTRPDLRVSEASSRTLAS